MNGSQEINVCMTLNTVEEAINNLELLSQELEKCSIKKEIYNSDFGYYLEQMSWEMHRMANETRERKSLWGDY